MTARAAERPRTAQEVALAPRGRVAVGQARLVAGADDGAVVRYAPS